MINWYLQAKQDLREYRSLCKALENIPEQLLELERRATEPRGVQYDRTPVQGGASGREESLARYIDLKTQLQSNLETTAAKVRRIERSLDALPQLERRVLELSFVEHWPASAVCEAVGYEERTVRNIKRRALSRFAVAMYGTTKP